MKKAILIAFLVIVVIAGAGVFSNTLGTKLPIYTTNPPKQPIACTQDAKLCSDGSYVSRSGPNCAFAQCPISKEPTPVTQKGTLKGHMTIGPICPVERIDNPCLPTPEMYASKKIYIYKADMLSKLRVATITPDAKGNFSIVLPVGNYSANMDSMSVGSITGIPEIIKIVNGGVVVLDINVDTGIR